MIRAQRRRHLLTWLVLGPALIALLAWVLWQRPASIPDTSDAIAETSP